MSRYLYNAAYYWEVVVDGRTRYEGYSIYLEERRTGRRMFVRTVSTERDMLAACKSIQQDLMMSEEEFEAKYGVSLTPRGVSEESPPER
ncbi:MAG: hypothetical protein ACUVTZ_01400 [Armatimonadota bacterium]